MSELNEILKSRNYLNILWLALGLIVGGLGVYFVVNKTNEESQSGNQGIVITKINAIDVNCITDNNGSIEILATSGNGPLQYNWGNGWIQNNKQSNLGVGTYPVSIKDNSGTTIQISQGIKSISDFTSISIQVVKQPATNTSSDGEIKAIPNGTSVPYSYSLNNGPTSNSGSFSNLNPGNYIIKITDSKGCKVSNQILLLSSISQPPIPPGECSSFNEIKFSNRIFPNRSGYWTGMGPVALESFLISTGGLVIGSKSCVTNRTITFKGPGSGQAIFRTIQANNSVNSFINVRGFRHNGDILNPDNNEGRVNTFPDGPIGDILSELITLGLNLINCDQYIQPVPQTKFGDFVFNTYTGNIYDGKKIKVIYDLINDKIGNCGTGLGLMNWGDDLRALQFINSRVAITCRN